MFPFIKNRSDFIDCYKGNRETPAKGIYDPRKLSENFLSGIHNDSKSPQNPGEKKKKRKEREKNKMESDDRERTKPKRATFPVPPIKTLEMQGSRHPEIRKIRSFRGSERAET